MTNMNDTGLDLGLDISIPNQWHNSNMGAGAGANANSRVDMMTFVGSDTLAELVWSPRTGLSIKFADKKPCFMWEVGPSDLGLLRSEDQKHVSEGGLLASQATCHVSGEIARSCSLVETPRSTSQRHTGSQNERVADRLSNHFLEDAITTGGDGSSSNIRSPLKIETVSQCGPRRCIERVENKEKDGCFVNSFLENAQDGILEDEKRVERRVSVPCQHKDTSFDFRETIEKHENESHGSMESANLLAKRKRELKFEQQSILGSKRIKKQTQERAIEKDKNRTFMNWISNMVKGLKKYDNYDPEISVCDEMGFRNVSESQIKNKFINGSHSGGSLEGFLKHVSLYERVTEEAPTGMFDTIRRLRLSRTDIIKWTNSRLSVAHLDGFFLRLRLATWAQGAGGARYYVACITGSQGEKPSKGSKKRIRVDVGGVECIVESRYVSNCDFQEDELVAWWEKTSKSGRTEVAKDLKSKVAERNKLGL